MLLRNKEGLTSTSDYAKIHLITPVRYHLDNITHPAAGHVPDIRHRMAVHVHLSSFTVPQENRQEEPCAVIPRKGPPVVTPDRASILLPVPVPDNGEPQDRVRE